MTPKEAVEVALKMLPVVHRDVEYKRIKQVGCDFDEQCRGTYFVLLEDYNGRSFSRANPAQVNLKERDETSVGEL